MCKRISEFLVVLILAMMVFLSAVVIVQTIERPVVQIVRERVIVAPVQIERVEQCRGRPA